MNIRNINVAKKYSDAFLNIYINKIDEKSFLNILNFYNFLQNNKDITSFLTLPKLSLSVKNEMITILLTKFDLPLDFKRLINLLIKTNRVSLLNQIVNEIIEEYQKRTSIILFEITSATILNNNQMSIIKKFIENKIKNKIIESYKVDKNLIAGIRIQSRNYLWENSISSKIRKLKQFLMLGY